MEDDPIERIKRFIEDHITEQITAADIAKASGYSQFHASRLFKAAVGISPFEYIRRERLMRSAVLLRKGNRKVVDVAFEYMFSSHEGFTRSFSKAFGITPKHFSSLKKTDGWLIPYRVISNNSISSEDKTMKNNTTVIFTQIVERPARKLLLKRSKHATHYMEYAQEVGCDDQGYTVPWQILSEIKEALYEPVGVWLPESMRAAGTGVYAHAVEIPIDYAGKVPEGFDLIDLPKCKMLVFQGEPYEDEKFEEAIGAMWEKVEEFNPKVYGYEYAPELSPRMQLSPQGWRGYIEMRPVREISG